MSFSELSMAARVAGVKADDGDDPAEIAEAIVARLGHAVGSAGTDPASIDKDCVKWLAHALKSSLPAGSGPDLLLGPLFVHAARQTLPIWRVAGYMMSLNAKTVRKDQVELIDRMVWRVMPHADALEVVRTGLQKLPAEGSIVSGLEMASAAQVDLSAVAAHRDWILVTLDLCLVLAMSDGKFQREEERCYAAMAQKLGLALEAAQTLRDKVTTTFWSRRARLAPPNTEQPAQVRANSLKAAFNTLEHDGTFDVLAAIVRAECVKAGPGGSAKPAWPMRLIAQISGRGNGDLETVLQVMIMAYAHQKQTQS